MTKTKIINGIISDGYRAKFCPITVRVTVAPIGKSMSLSDDKNIMLQIGLEAVSDMIAPAGEWK